MGNYEEYNWNDILAYFVSTDILTLFLILTFVVLGGICKDYLDYKTKVKIVRTIVASFVVSFALFAYRDCFSSLNVLLLFGYMFGYASDTVHLLLLKTFSDEKIIKRLLSKVFSSVSSLSDIIEDDNKKQD